jgi:thymidine kinase
MLEPGARRPAGNASGRGVISLLCGCMFSGKTTLMFRWLEAYPPPSVLALKHVIDQRYSADAIVSHGGKAWPAEAIRAASDIPGRVRAGIKVIALDEAHFFDDSLVTVVGELADGGIDVILASLDADSWGHSFEVVEALRQIADEVRVLHARCARCGGGADRTQRLTPIVGGQLVGGPESYEPRCQACWSPPPEDPPDWPPKPP